MSEDNSKQSSHKPLDNPLRHFELTMATSGGVVLSLSTDGPVTCAFSTIEECLAWLSNEMTRYRNVFVEQVDQESVRLAHDEEA